MNWKVKCASSYLLSNVPLSMPIYNALQKHFTGRWTRNVGQTMAVPNNYTMHIEAFRRHWGDIESAAYFEFGVARDLFSTLVNYCCGMSRQLAVDLNPLATSELINDTIRQLRAVSNPHMIRHPEHDLGPDFKADLLKHYGIDYHAPQDARNVNMPDGSIDLIASTSTFEHVPEAMLREILAESYRLCHEGSIVSHEITYGDHYSHTDKSITPYNFLQFSEQTWERLYMRHYYQNRLRHNDIRRMIVEAGFTILEETPMMFDNAEEMLASVRLAKPFDTYPKSDLLATRGHFVARK
jgi:hypothetical protein